MYDRIAEERSSPAWHAQQAAMKAAAAVERAKQEKRQAAAEKRAAGKVYKPKPCRCGRGTRGKVSLKASKGVPKTHSKGCHLSQK